MRERIVAFLMVSVLCGGCATTSSLQLSEYRPVPLKPSVIMPTKAELSGAPLKAVVFPLRDKHLMMGSRAEVGRTVADTLQKYLSQAGVQVLDRSLYGKLKDEIRLAEIKGSTDYHGPQVADFAISGDITNANYSHSFTEQTTYQGKDGKYYTIPASCNFQTSVSGNIVFYRLPSMQVEKSVSVGANENWSRNSRYSNCRLSDAELFSELRNAASEAVTKSRTQIQNIFAPRGYVLERREDKNGGSIFDVSIGSTQGAAQGVKCDFYQDIRTTNQLTGKSMVDKYVVAAGNVSNLVGPNHAWIVVSNKKAANKIQLGDEVKVHYSKGFMESIQDFVH